MNDFDVVGMGTIVVDHQVVLPSLPDPDTKCDALWDRLQVGGPVPTAVALLARWGLRCSFLGSWSDDWHGQLIEEDLEQLQVDTSGAIRVSGGRTGFAHVWVDQQAGTRTICCLRPEPVERLLHDQSRFVLEHSRVLHVDGWPAACALEAVEYARGCGTCVAIDTGSLKPTTMDILKQAQLINCPRRFLTQLFGSDDVTRARELLQWGAEVVTVTDGAAGAWLWTPAGAWQLPAVDVEAVDTTGAGDIFTGALIYAWLQELPPQEMLKAAVATAGLKCRHFGNREAIPDVSEVEAVMARMEVVSQ